MSVNFQMICIHLYHAMKYPALKNPRIVFFNSLGCVHILKHAVRALRNFIMCLYFRENIIILLCKPTLKSSKNYKKNF